MVKHGYLVKSLGGFMALAVGLLASQVHSQEKPSGEQQGELKVVEMKEAEGVAEQVNMIEEMIGHIDWEKKVVYAVGDGVMPPDAISPAQARARAKRAAIDTAYARLLEAVQEVRVDSESTTRNFVNENNVVRVKVQGFVKNAEIEKLKHFEDGSYQIMMRMPLTGAKGLTAAIFPIQLESVRRVRVGFEISRGDPPARQAASPVVVIEPAAEAGKTKGEMTEPEAKVEQQGSAFTGIIVDARGLGVKPALYPRILTEDGKPVYDLASADPNATIEEGLVDYRKSMAEAKKVARVGDNPLVVKATGLSGKYGADIVISRADASRVSRSGKDDILSAARVVVVTD